MDQILCPCGAELTSVFAARSVQLQKEDGKWIEKHVFSSDCQCPNCYEEIDEDTLDKLGVPVEYR